MIKKCIGCGLSLQTESTLKEGYISHKVIETAEYCERCFKIKNYGEYSVLDKEIDYEKLIYNIDRDTSAAVVYLIDVLNINKESVKYLDFFSNKKYILLTKRDILPKSIKDKKLLKYFKENIYGKCEVFTISSGKKYNIDEFLNILKKEMVKKIYVVGFTNSGKSTFINTVLLSKGIKATTTTSPIPNTTASIININLPDFQIIDTPGFIDENSIYNFLGFSDVKKISPKKELKVKTFQIKPEFSILLEGLLRVDYESSNNNSLNFYMNDNLEYQKIRTKTNDKLKYLPCKTLDLKGKEDIVINGLGFIRVMHPCQVTIYTIDEKLISVRKSMI